MKIFYCLLIFTNLAYAWPESERHSHFPFVGTPLPESSRPLRTTPSFALYHDKGVWDSGYEHLKMFFTEHKLGYFSISAKEVLGGVLESSGASVLVMPGGESWEYLKSLGSDGAEKIKNFVAKGGGYIGICAGAFYAVSLREGGHATGEYGIGLLKGTAYDGTALHTDPFIDGMMDFDLMPISPLKGLASAFRIVLFGGPSFRYSPGEAQAKNLQVLAQFQKIEEPAMILFRYGSGQVYLSAPHLEIEEDRTNWGSEFLDPDSEWPILERVGSALIKNQKQNHSKSILR